MTLTLALSVDPAIDVWSEADSVRTTHKVRIFNEGYDAGGGGVNVARAINELGGDVEVPYHAGGVTGGRCFDELRSVTRSIASSFSIPVRNPTAAPQSNS